MAAASSWALTILPGLLPFPQPPSPKNAGMPGSPSCPLTPSSSQGYPGPAGDRGRLGRRGDKVGMGHSLQHWKHFWDEF